MKKLVFVICTILCANVVSAQETFIIGDLTYKVIQESQVEVTYCNLFAESIIVPEKVTFEEKTYNVIYIGREAFYKLPNLTSVKLPEGIVYIKDHAFYKCKNLTSINIPNTIYKIGNSAFEGCSSLSDITIPESVTSIGDYAFYKCGNLSVKEIPNTVEKLGEFAFGGSNVEKNSYGSINEVNILPNNKWIENDNVLLTGTNLPLRWIMPAHKSVFGAGFLSFLFPGVGQLYATNYDKGWGYIAWTSCGFPLLLVCTEFFFEHNAFYIQCATLAAHIVIGICSMIDAVNLAKQVNMQNGYLSFNLGDKASLGFRPEFSYNNMTMPSGSTSPQFMKGISMSLRF